MSGWQPISTAPKGRRWFLAFGPFGHNERLECAIIRRVKPRGGGEYGPFVWATPDSYGAPSWAENLPTHWMPLPPAPTPSKPEAA